MKFCLYLFKPNISQAMRPCKQYIQSTRAYNYGRPTGIYSGADFFNFLYLFPFVVLAALYTFADDNTLSAFVSQFQD